MIEMYMQVLTVAKSKTASLGRDGFAFCREKISSAGD